MAKNLVTLATVISIRPLGENNSSVTLLTRSEGIIFATMYGGSKSRLKSLVSPWNTGTAYLSISNQTQYKISDFDVSAYHLTFRENLTKNCIASLAAEIAIKTKCAGSPVTCWALINGFINGLDKCQNSEQCTSGLIRFLWRYLETMGIKPETETCCHCGNKFHQGAFWNQIENGFNCTGCGSSSLFYITQNGLNYLNNISLSSTSDTESEELEKDSIAGLKQLLFFLIENACGSKLASLKTGTGIL